MDTPGPKADSMISQVQYLQDHGTPIDGVGFRSHFVTGQLPSKEDLIANYERFTALGIEIAITELDIRLSVSAAGLVQQQRDYQTVISACKAVAGCVGVTLSEIADRVGLAFIQLKLTPFQSLALTRFSSGSILRLRVSICFLLICS
jgi:endo-1,4-beta-xylanase